MTMAYDKGKNTYSYHLSDDDLNSLLTAMREQGRVDIGYGDISNRQSLLDTYTGGLNMLTGLTSDSLNAMSDDDAKKAIKAALETTPVALLSRSVMACDNYINDTTTVDQFTDTMGSVLKDAANTEHTISTVYSDLGNKYSLVETTKTRLDTLSDNLTEEYKDILSYGIGDTVTLVSKKTRTREKQRIVKITEYPESPEKNTVEISNARKTFAEIQKEETAAATEEAVSISNRATKKVLESYSTTEEIETKITASKEAIEEGVSYKLKNYYTQVEMDSLIKATKDEISQEVKHVEENSMHNYVVNGDFSNGFDDNWYNNDETNNSVMDVPGLGTVAKILKTSSSSSYIRQNLGKIPAGTYRVRYKAATAAGYESTARVQVGALGSYSTTSSGMLKSKEFTTIEREITVSEGTKYIYIYAYTQNAPVYITDIEVLGLYSLYADAKIQVTAEEITSEVNKKVNSDDFGTLITQNAYNVRIAFNKGSSYMQFDSTAITMYTGTITDNQKRTRFDYNGTHFYRDGYYVGKIGTNTMKDNDSQRGLVFDIEYNTAYMSWSNKESQNADVYTMKWSYCTQQCGNYEANMLHAGADINMHFFTLRNVSFEDGSISGTLTFKQPLEVGSDGKLTKWSTATLEFKRGILVSGTWSNG